MSGIVRPAYGRGSLADLLPSVSAVLGLPGADDVLGLGRSAAGGIGGAERVAVLLVDGLGAHQIPIAARYAPVLGGLSGGTLTAPFPSTTPVSLTTLGTGVPPGEHGILGFRLRQPDGRIVAHLHWDDDPDPLVWQPVPTRLEALAAAGIAATVVSRPEFEGGGLTRAAWRGARYSGASDGPAVAAGMLAALAGGSGPALVYGYHPDLDRAGHEHGVDSPQWQAAAAGVGDLVERLLDGLPAGCALLITADHGQIDIPMDGRLDLSAVPELSAGLVAVTGEARARYLHTTPGAAGDVLDAYRGRLGSSALVLSRDEAVEDGWWGPVAPRNRGRIGDVVVIPTDDTVLLASGWEPASVARMVAFHGSVTEAEMTVPLLVVPPG